MAEHIDSDRDAVLARLRDAPCVFCGVDYDGTLAPIAATPAEAQPYPGTLSLLQRLAAAAHVHVAIVTGRAIADVRAFLDVPQAYYVGIHGLELKRPGEAVDFSAAGRRARALQPAVSARLHTELGDLPGLLIEEKGAALALHYRLATPADAARGRAVIEAAVHELLNRGEPLDLLEGHEVIEVRPQGIDKGRALCELLARDAPAALVLYIGDDQTDEDAFRALPASALTIRVGPADVDTAATYRLNDPAEVHAFLRTIADLNDAPTRD